jgi:hypothetical protein
MFDAASIASLDGVFAVDEELRFRWRAAVIVLSAAGFVLLGAGPGAQTLPAALAPDGIDRPSVCGTQPLRHLRAEATAPDGIADGEPLFFEQDPPLVSANYDGPITLRHFNVVGDFATVQFRRYDPAQATGRLETWTRVNSRSVDGRVISIFEPSWSSAELATSLGHNIYGVDRPDLYWGALLVAGSSDERAVRLRMDIDGLPTSQVVRINDRVQYASNVVNLVIPGFGDARVSSGQTSFEVSTATRTFYQYFSDLYDVIGFQPQAVMIGDFGAFHQNVRNDVTGLNLPVFDQTAAYGSAGALRGAELYLWSNSVRYEDTNHEMAHQWASTFDWTTITGITRQGWRPASHSPLWTGGETLIGAVLYDDRRVRTRTDGYDIERTPAPARYHPIELYSMGKLDASQVPNFVVFSDQGQFDADTASSPDVGTHVTGDAQLVGIDDVIRIHGVRNGPSPSTWRRATVVVSRDRLVSPREMDYWNFFAQRLADRTRSNPPTLKGYGSFRAATQNTVTLTTNTQPLTQPPLPELLDTAGTPFGPASWRGVAFSTAVSSNVHVGELTTLSGRVTARDAVDFNLISVFFYKIDGSSSIRFDGTVGRSGDFAITVRFTDAQRGSYYMAVYLYWPNSGSQYARASVSTITVE